jgi:hypothetical protein
MEAENDKLKKRSRRVLQFVQKRPTRNSHVFGGVFSCFVAGNKNAFNWRLANELFGWRSAGDDWSDLDDVG